jgi:hypothetical protein
MQWSNEQRAFAVEAYFSKKEVSLPHPIYSISQANVLLDRIWYITSTNTLHNHGICCFVYYFHFNNMTAAVFRFGFREPWHVTAMRATLT